VPHFARSAKPRPARASPSSNRGDAAPQARRYPCAPFWDRLRTRLERERPAWKLGSPNRNDYPLFSPLPEARIKCNFSRQGLRVELLLQSNDRAKNLDRLAVLENNLPQLQAAFGRDPHLRPEPLEGKTQARLAAYRPGQIDAQHEWAAYLDWFIDTATRLTDALDAAPVIRANWPS
jgi:hypothetical protein